MRTTAMGTRRRKDSVRTIGCSDHKEHNRPTCGLRSKSDGRDIAITKITQQQGLPGTNTNIECLRIDTWREAGIHAWCRTLRGFRPYTVRVPVCNFPYTSRGP
ncbi:unnamed protein product, partial [Ectocarpus fasciculatus]